MSLDKIILELGLDNTKFVSGLSTAERRMMRMSDKIGKSMGTAERSWKTFEKAIERSDKGLQQLRSSLDPTYAAMKRYEQAQKQVAQALAYNTISQKEANQILAQARSAYGIATAETKRFGAMTRQMRSSVQNASFQISDMAVQLEMGTNPMRVMSQQIPQLLGGFGAMGAAIGTVVAVGLPLANMFFRSGEEMEAAEKKAESFDAALSKASASVSAATSAMKDSAVADLETIVSKYGEASDAVLRLLDNLASDKEKEAIADLGNAVSEAFSLLDENAAIREYQNNIQRAVDLKEELRSIELSGGEIDTKFNDRLQQSIEQLQRIEPIAEKLKITPEAFQSLLDYQAIIERLISEGDKLGAADQISAMREEFEAVAGVASTQVFPALTQIENEIRKAIGSSSEIENSFRLIWGQAETLVNLTDQEKKLLSAIPAEVQRMAAELGLTVDELIKAYDWTNDLADAFVGAANEGFGVAAAADSIAGAISGAVAEANALVSALGAAQNAYNRAQINSQFRKDAIGRAGALAGLQFDQQFGVSDGLKGMILEGAKAIVTSSARATAALNEETKAANEADRAAERKATNSRRRSRGGGRGGGRGSMGAAHAANEAARAAERQAKAYETLKSQLDPMMAQMDKYREQLALINEQAKTQEEREKMVGLLDQQRDKALLGSEYDDYESELTKLNNWYTEKSEIINGWREQELLTADAHYRMMNEIERRYAEHRRVALLDGYGAMLGTLTGLVKGWAGEQSDAYRAAAAVEKSWALFSVAAKAQPAMAQEWNSPEHTTFFQRLAASAAVGAKFGLFQQIVASLTPGFAAGGVVPGSSISGDNVLARLNSKEMVLTQTQQARLFRMANGREGGGSAQQPVTVINTLNSDEIFANVSPANLSAMVKNEIASNPSEYRQILQ